MLYERCSPLKIRVTGKRAKRIPLHYFERQRMTTKYDEPGTGGRGKHMAYDQRGAGRGYGKPNGEKKSYGERSYGDKPYDKKRYNDGERTYGKPQGDRKPSGERSCGDKPYDKKRYNDGERSYGKPQGDRKPYGERSYGDKPYDKKRYSDGERSYGKKKAYGDKPYERKPADARRERPAEPEETVQQGGADEAPYLLIGRNAVREAIKNGRSIDRILVTKEQDGSLGEIVRMARDRNLVLRETDRRKLDELCMPFGHGGKTANHQGVVAYAAGVEYCTVGDILKSAREKGEDPFVIVLDGIEDPHNLGSIIRSAECAGAHGVVIGKRRSASVTAAAVKAAAGATEYMKVARVVNISGAIEELKRAKLWVAGADMHGTDMTKQGLNGPLALVIGSEGDGLSKLVRESCDFLVSIPMKGHIDSLNAGVAAAVLMFEKRRQDAIGD